LIKISGLVQHQNDPSTGTVSILISGGFGIMQGG